jgi:hypothetical protein
MKAPEVVKIAIQMDDDSVVVMSFVTCEYKQWKTVVLYLIGQESLP